MDEKERTELEKLTEKKQRTQKESERYKELLMKLFKEELYLGSPEG